MKKVILLVSMIAIFLVGCQNDVALITVNEEIPKKVAESVDEVLAKLTEAVTNSDADSFSKLCVPGTETLNGVYFNEFSNNGRLFIDFFLEKNLEKEAKYYITDITKEGESVPYVTEGYDFVIPTPDGGEGSRVVYLAEGEYNNFDIMLTIVIAENDGDFNIEKFTLGDIRPYGDSIVSLIDKAEGLEAEENLISAWLYNELAGEFISPSPYVYYSNDDLVADSMVRIADLITKDFTFPIDVKIAEDTYVQLYAITSNKYDDGFYCRVIYVSNVPENQANETIIKAEAKKLHASASELLKGLGEGFDGNILYTAYFEEPVEQGKDYKYLTVDIKE